MSALAPRFGFNGDVQCFAGEVLAVELAFTNGTDATVSLEGRQFALVVWEARTRAEVASTAGDTLSDATGDYVRFAIDGDTTEEFFRSYRAVTLRIGIVELLAGGIDVRIEGSLTLRSAPAGISPQASQPVAGPPVARYVFDYISRRTIVSARGAPGLSASAQLAADGMIADTSAAALGDWLGAFATAAATQAADTILADFAQVRILADVLIPSGATAILADTGNDVLLGDLL